MVLNPCKSLLNESEKKLNQNISLNEITRLAHLEADRRMLLNNGGLAAPNANDLLAGLCDEQTAVLTVQEKADWETLRTFTLDAARSKDAKHAQTCLLLAEALTKIHAGLREALNV